MRRRRRSPARPFRLTTSVANPLRLISNLPVDSPCRRNYARPAPGESVLDDLEAIPCGGPSTLPAASVARTLKLCLPSSRRFTRFGDVHGLNGFSVDLALERRALLVGARTCRSTTLWSVRFGGDLVIVVSGGSESVFAAVAVSVGRRTTVCCIRRLVRAGVGAVGDAIAIAVGGRCRAARLRRSDGVGARGRRRGLKSLALTLVSSANSCSVAQPAPMLRVSDWPSGIAGAGVPVGETPAGSVVAAPHLTQSTDPNGSRVEAGGAAGPGGEERAAQYEIEGDAGLRLRLIDSRRGSCADSRH